MALPWTLPDPKTRRPAKYDCSFCRGPEGPGEGTRAFMRCGWMERKQWPAGEGDVPLMMGPFPYDQDVCPGYLVQLEDVTESARAWRAKKDNALPLYDPTGSNLVWECVEIATRAFDAYEAEQLRPGAR